MKLIDLYESEGLEKAKAFVRKLYSRGHPNPFGGGTFFNLKGDNDEEGLVKVLLHPMGNGTVHISELISTDYQGKGFGSYVLKIITDLADKEDITLNLFAKPISVRDKKDIPLNKLISFYKKAGFKSGKVKQEMIREPK